ncbi:hypothetical protein M422DRAFT_245449 [Sphaerobolus stellatus SS14]|nr:hypothetical protein M422DRAFT_245449 [Sphaerobolus stellatus SS14]
MDATLMDRNKPQSQAWRSKRRCVAKFTRQGACPLFDSFFRFQPKERRKLADNLGYIKLELHRISNDIRTIRGNASKEDWNEVEVGLVDDPAAGLRPYVTFLICANFSEECLKPTIQVQTSKPLLGITQYQCQVEEIPGRGPPTVDKSKGKHKLIPFDKGTRITQSRLDYFRRIKVLDSRHGAAERKKLAIMDDPSDETEDYMDALR